MVCSDRDASATARHTARRGIPHLLSPSLCCTSSHVAPLSPSPPPYSSVGGSRRGLFRSRRVGGGATTRPSRRCCCTTMSLACIPFYPVGSSRRGLFRSRRLAYALTGSLLTYFVAIPSWIACPVSRPQSSTQRLASPMQLHPLPCSTDSTTLVRISFELSLPSLTCPSSPIGPDDKPIATYEFADYCKTHKVLENIWCFCSAQTQKNMQVRLFRANTGSHAGAWCLGCPRWRPQDQRDSCNYFGTSFIRCRCSSC